MPKYLLALRPFIALLLLAFFSGCKPGAQATLSSNSSPSESTGRSEQKDISKEQPKRSPASDTTPADPDVALEKAADNLPLGQVAVQHPDQMYVKRADTVKVAITRDQKLNLIKELSSSGEDIEQNSIAVSASMKVQVFGSPYFDVQPLSDEEQLIPDQGTTEWSFNVVPLQAGDLPLHVTIAAVVRAEGIEKAKDFPVRDEIIRVHVSLLASLQSFAANNWQWLWSTVLVPLGAWLWSRKRKGRTVGPVELNRTRKSRGRGAA